MKITAINTHTSIKADEAGFEPVALYCRFSSDNQTENSLAYQLTAAENYCKKNNLRIASVYSDAAYSGTNDRRPEFQRMMQDARNGPEWKTVLVYKLNRFSRNAADHVKYETELAKLGIKCVSVTETFSDTPLGRHERRVQASHNQLVSEEIAEHTTSGMLETASQGLHCGGRPPLGYKVVDRKLAIDEPQAKIVKLIFKLYDQGKSYRQIADYLNKQDYRTQEGKKFTKNSFNSILTQEKYIGTYIWNKASKKASDGTRNSHRQKAIEEQIRIEEGCPAIIDRDTFIRIQEKMKSRKGGNRTRHHYMLTSTGRLKCAYCGHKMEGGTRKNHKGETYTVYYCPNHRSGSCKTKEVRAEVLDRFTLKALMFRRIRKSDIPELSRQVSNDGRLSELKQKKRRLEGAIQSNLATMERRPSDQLSQRYEQNCDELDQVEDELARLESADALITKDNYMDVSKRLKDYIRQSDDPDVLDFLKQHISEIRYGNIKTIVHVSG